MEIGIFIPHVIPHISLTYHSGISPLVSPVDSSMIKRFELLAIVRDL